MAEFVLMNPSKETENMLRWSDDIDGVNFSLYIPKWRVPKPWPSSILVVVDDKVARVQEKRISYINDHLEEPIFKRLSYLFILFQYTYAE
jgi:hypothetical protein